MPKTKPFDLHADEYDNWFTVNEYVFRSELNAIKKVLPEKGNIIEIGIGSGMFAVPLGINEGIEPSESMREKAKKRHLRVIDAVAEDLPYTEKSKNAVLMVTTICFLDNVYKSLQEVHRILKNDGRFIIGFVDKDSPIGKLYLQQKDKNIFYEDATFFGTTELYGLLKNSGFKIISTYQTVFGRIDEIDKIQKVMTGHGQGSFIVIETQKV